MKLPKAPPEYQQRDQDIVRSSVEKMARETHSKNQDLEMGLGRLILESPNGTKYKLQVSDGGVLSAATL